MTLISSRICLDNRAMLPFGRWENVIGAKTGRIRRQQAIAAFADLGFAGHWTD
jgi:hypothetical protein